MRHVLGADYAWTMPFPSASGWLNASDYQKASLVGQRLVQSVEMARRGELNDELIKTLTGGDTVNARHPYGRPFMFSPMCKIFLRVNEKPIIHDQSHGMWRRVKLLSFLQTFPINQVLALELMEEATGIFAWMVRGCLAWQREGLCHPSSVEAATDEYRSESDPLVEFLEEQCVIAPTVKVAAGALFNAYKNWCDEQQVPLNVRMSQKTFGAKMKATYEAKISGQGNNVTYFGIGLRAPTSTYDPEM